MTESKNGASLSTWSAPECPFTIEYSPQTLDDIRLAIMDAFFSLPRGGAEIGGVLFGHWDGERLAITDYGALDCEHAFGPTFTLSPPDEDRLAHLLAASDGNGARPVGWYHSHTRSEIFLSDADREIHRRFFPEPWQVALVLKPHTYHPTRAGFFFRGADGAIHAETSYNEFLLLPLSVKPAPAGAPETADAGPETPPTPDPLPVRQSVPQDAPPFAVAVPVAEPEAPAQALPLPMFLSASQPRSRRWPKVVLALLVGFALGAAIYWKRDLWLPPALALAQRLPGQAQPPPLGLNTIDEDGQLQIRWNRNSSAVQQASGGLLSIDAGGPVPQEIALDKAHLLSGVFTFARQTERVDVSLGLIQPDGHPAREVTTFMGKLPEPKPAEDGATPEERDSLAKQVAKIQADLDAEIERNTKLKKSVDQLNKRIHDQQRGRQLNQVPRRK